MLGGAWGLDQTFKQRNAVFKPPLIEIQICQCHLIRKDVATCLDPGYEFISRNSLAFNPSEKSHHIKLGTGIVGICACDISKLLFSVVKSPLGYIDAHELITHREILGFLIN